MANGDEEDEVDAVDEHWLKKMDASEIILDYTQMKLIEEENKQKEKPK